jgi:hypothetical protein
MVGRWKLLYSGRSQGNIPTGLFARKFHKIFGLAVMLALTLIWGCAPRFDHYDELNRHVYNQDYDAALMLMEESKDGYRDRDAALYYMEEGLIFHFAGRYQESNQYLFKAETILEDLFTRSISNQTASFIINDNTIPYRGEDFEDALVNLFLAINYAVMGMTDDALVEARKLDIELNIVNSHYEENQRNVYREDAFIRFLMGLFYESGGEINNAFISYRKAEEIYRNDYLPNYGVSPPPFLIENLLSTALTLGFYQELAEIRQSYPDIQYPQPGANNNSVEIIVIHYNGIGPEKVERSWAVPMPDGYLLTVAYPVFQHQNYLVSHGVVRLRSMDTGKTFQFSTELMEDIGAIAVLNLENRMARIKTKAIARATTKYLATITASKAAHDQAGDLAGLMVQLAGNIVAVATERADVRYWRMLPDEVRVGRGLVPAGRYQGEIEYVDSYGNVLLTRRLEPFNAVAGEKKYFTQRTMW